MAAWKLLIADDEPIVRHGLENSVNWDSLGFMVTGVFSCGRDVIRYLEENPADVILSDIRMQDGSGLDLAEWVNTHRPQTDIVLLTGYTDYEAAKKAVNYGVVKYLINKPLSMEELRNIFRTLSEKHAQSQLDQEQIHQMNLHCLRQVLQNYEGGKLLWEKMGLSCVGVLLRKESELSEEVPSLYSQRLLRSFHGVTAITGEARLLLYPCAKNQVDALSEAARSFFSIRAEGQDAQIILFSSPDEIGKILNPNSDMSGSGQNSLFQAIDAYLQKHFTEKITLSDAACYLHYSTGYFSRKFKEEARISFGAYILRQRISYAKKLLAETNQSIREIASAAGFDDVHHFAQVFKRKTGMTPSAYRRFHPGEAEDTWNSTNA